MGTADVSGIQRVIEANPDLLLALSEAQQTRRPVHRWVKVLKAVTVPELEVKFKIRVIILKVTRFSDRAKARDRRVGV